MSRKLLILFALSAIISCVAVCGGCENKTNPDVSPAPTARIRSSEPTETENTTADVSQSDASQGDMTPSDMTPSDMTPSDITPNSVVPSFATTENE